MKKKDHTYADILRAARKRVENGSNDYICYAISNSNRGVAKQRNYLRAWIMYMLETHSSYEAWLRTKHHKLFKQTIRKEGVYGWVRGVRKARLAWIDWMIEQVGDAK